MNSAQVPSLALRAAVDWLVRHEAETMSAADQQAFKRWLQQDAQHQAAWERVRSALEEPLTAVRNLQAHTEGLHAQAAMQALFQTRRRRVLRGALALGGIGVANAWVADRLTPLGQVMADLRTGTGERREFKLADGSTVLLDARSAVDVHNAAGTPALQLRAGALIATRASAGAAPLQIRTRDGVALLDAGRMMGRVYADRTDMVALDQGLTLRPRETAQALLQAGQGASFSARQLLPLGGNAVERAAWQQGMLAVDDWPLAEVAQALQPYFSGYIRVAPSVADLRVFGIFRLEVDALLNTLSQMLPLQIQRLGPLISIGEKVLR
jgi:transmembrane sensor